MGQARFCQNDWYARVRFRTSWNMNPREPRHLVSIPRCAPYTQGARMCADLYQLTGPIETTSCDYEMIESVNEELFNNLSDLVKTPFFRYFQASHLAALTVRGC